MNVNQNRNTATDTNNREEGIVFGVNEFYIPPETAMAVDHGKSEYEEVDLGDGSDMHKKKSDSTDTINKLTESSHAHVSGSSSTASSSTSVSAATPAATSAVVASAGAAVVTVVTILSTVTPVIYTPPSVDALYLQANENAIYFEFDAEGVDNTIGEYHLIITSDTETILDRQIEKDGFYRIYQQGLSPETQYYVSLFSTAFTDTDSFENGFSETVTTTSADNPTGLIGVSQFSAEAFSVDVHFANHETYGFYTLEAYADGQSDPFYTQYIEEEGNTAIDYQSVVSLEGIQTDDVTLTLTQNSLYPEGEEPEDGNPYKQTVIATRKLKAAHQITGTHISDLQETLNTDKSLDIRGTYLDYDENASSGPVMKFSYYTSYYEQTPAPIIQDLSLSDGQFHVTIPLEEAYKYDYRYYQYQLYYDNVIVYESELTENSVIKQVDHPELIEPAIKEVSWNDNNTFNMTLGAASLDQISDEYTITAEMYKKFEDDTTMMMDFVTYDKDSKTFTFTNEDSMDDIYISIKLTESDGPYEDQLYLGPYNMGSIERSFGEVSYIDLNHIQLPLNVTAKDPSDALKLSYTVKVDHIETETVTDMDIANGENLLTLDVGSSGEYVEFIYKIREISDTNPEVDYFGNQNFDIDNALFLTDTYVDTAGDMLHMVFDVRLIKAYDCYLKYNLNSAGETLYPLTETTALIPLTDPGINNITYQLWDNTNSVALTDEETYSFNWDNSINSSTLNYSLTDMSIEPFVYSYNTDGTANAYGYYEFENNESEGSFQLLFYDEENNVIGGDKKDDKYFEYTDLSLDYHYPSCMLYYTSTDNTKYYVDGAILSMNTNKVTPTLDITAKEQKDFPDPSDTDVFTRTWDLTVDVNNYMVDQDEDMVLTYSYGSGTKTITSTFTYYDSMYEANYYSLLDGFESGTLTYTAINGNCEVYELLVAISGFSFKGDTGYEVTKSFTTSEINIDYY